MGFAFLKCRKCGSEIRFGQRDYAGVSKWIPLSLDGTDHWNVCRFEQRKYWTPAQILAECEEILPAFWTVPDGRGSFKTLREMPSRFGIQPEGELF